MSHTVFEVTLPEHLYDAFDAAKLQRRDAAVNQLVCENIDPQSIDFADVSLSLSLHADAFPMDAPVADVAAETLERLAAALMAAAGRIRPPRRPSIASQYAA